ncbi:MAG: relaxase/mobilization nuclease domain-containing protein [Gemmiger sp.]|uniref:relaxase/mobilization nuclease domain-containing protein n=1 Tax=Gemmiger sp. TaxID=2049027 RepID=UPI002A9154AD|nr:relaxase/mobilization nuclease domain-containing protein [Gemmiger sp.]MDY5326677.1 relaxase/mobilization nuclease domain-containing protein [Gemmiger sp.]
MAYTSIIPVHRLDRAVDYVQNKEKTTRRGATAKSLEDAIDYALNREKTEQTCFETGLACTTATAFADMKACKQRWHKLGGVQGFHLVQSFKAGEVTPELAHQIGVELAEQLLGGRYQAVVTTHLNTSHCHNHIVWNSVALDNGKKYHSNAKTYVTEVRAISDALCEKYGLSVIHSDRADAVSQPYQDWLADKEGRPGWRTAIRQDVDEAVSQSFTWRQFVHTLEGKGYELRMNRKHPTLRPPGMERCVRFKTLGKRYTPEALQMRILYANKQPPTGAALTVYHGRLRSRSKRKLTGLWALYYRYLYELGALPRKPLRPGYAVREDIRNLDRRIAQMEFLSHNGITTLEQLETHRLEKERQIQTLTAQRRMLYRTAPGSPEISAINARLKPLRREERLCRQIAAQSTEMQRRLDEDERLRRERQKQDRQRIPFFPYETR